MACDNGQGGNETGVPQIEVTPEMIRAGLGALVGFDWNECAAEAHDVVMQVWTAMLAAART